MVEHLEIVSWSSLWSWPLLFLYDLSSHKVCSRQEKMAEVGSKGPLNFPSLLLVGSISSFISLLKEATTDLLRKSLWLPGHCIHLLWWQWGEFPLPRPKGYTASLCELRKQRKEKYLSPQLSPLWDDGGGYRIRTTITKTKTKKETKHNNNKTKKPQLSERKRRHLFNWKCSKGVRSKFRLNLEWEDVAY